MSKKYKIAFSILLLLLGGSMLGMLYMYREHIAVLNPKGWIALEEQRLIHISTWLMLIVVIPVVFLTLFFAWKYRASRKREKYDPDWDQSHLLECIWWGIPCAIIFVLGVITWKKCHELDPFEPIVTGVKPLKIQVIALQWKWLFLYPEYDIASVSYLRFPEKTPLYFDITSDAPMNSFWIPDLGGQIYAMAGMNTKLHLIADRVGIFKGASANLSGKGFSGMTFVAEATSEEDFEAWVKKVKRSSPSLHFEDYLSLAKPSENVPAASFVLKEPDLYRRIVMKYEEHTCGED